jgi:hypothetical protein
LVNEDLQVVKKVGKSKEFDNLELLTDELAHQSQ